MMSRRPTMLGTPSAVLPQVQVVDTANVPAVVSVATPALAGVVDLGNFPVTLDTEQLRVIADRLAGMDFLTMPGQAIALIGADAEQELQRTLDGFLGGMDRLHNPKLFELFACLQKGVDEQKLPTLANRILGEEQGLLANIGNWLDRMKSKDARQQAAQVAREETVRLVKGATKSLVDLIASMEVQMKLEQARLTAEIGNMDRLTESYRERFGDFVVAVAMAQAFLNRARQQVAQFEQSMRKDDPIQAAQLDELRDKLQGLESRALALEGTMTRLPADQLVLRQLKGAGIDTLREVATTAVARSSSIKMTLVTLGHTLAVKGVHALAAQGADLDRNLSGVRGRLMQDVVTTAANAAGNNRVAQAEQIQGIVTETGELMAIVARARTDNETKFATARQMFADARQQMFGLAHQVPDRHS